MWNWLGKQQVLSVLLSDLRRIYLNFDYDCRLVTFHAISTVLLLLYSQCIVYSSGVMHNCSAKVHGGTQKCGRTLCSWPSWGGGWGGRLF